MQNSPEERLMKLEQDLKYMASVVSRQSGELQALQAAFYGFLIIAGGIPEINRQIDLELEKCGASNLGSSTNQDRVDGFDETANLIRLAMASVAASPPQQVSPGSKDLGVQD
ncbi:hypothetical protein ACLBKS_10725 [Hylemonella sp. W303a]|uniref:hypothetical protein n=1 Tax=Hylemonella sp. W303a TaxID=3389873 RepID=UPI00396B066F